MDSKVIEVLIKTYDGVIIDEYDTEHYKIPGKKYDIQRSSRREWTCDCPAFKWQRKFKKNGCKHIKQIKNEKLTRILN